MSQAPTNARRDELWPPIGFSPVTDVISDVLRSIRLSGTLYFEAQLTAPWGIDIADTGFANFHHVAAGSCWLSFDGGPWTELGAGESVVFPHGATHTLCHRLADGTNGIGGTPGNGGAARSGRVEGNGSVDGQALFQYVDDDGVARMGGPGPQTTLVCGHFSYDQELSHPLLQALPPVIRGEQGRHPGWTNLAQLAVARSKDFAPGSQALTDRLAEVLLIELLSDLDQQESGFTHALADPIVASALQAIHDDPAQGWTVASLASHCATSRSALAGRFTDLVGESPIRYLTRWRMHRAAHLLRETTLPAARVATLVGYSTPFSFTKAFARELGVPPTVYRNQTEATPA